MAEPPELWTFIFANLVMFGFGAVLTGLSFYAYYTNDRQRSFRNSTIGFGLLTLGGLVDPVYQLGIKGGNHALVPRELLALQTIEGFLIAVGLGMLFYSIYQHNTKPRRLTTTIDNYPERR